jgi:hypothetical protein
MLAEELAMKPSVRRTGAATGALIASGACRGGGVCAQAVRTVAQAHNSQSDRERLLLSMAIPYSDAPGFAMNGW